MAETAENVTELPVQNPRVRTWQKLTWVCAPSAFVLGLLLATAWAYHFGPLVVLGLWLGAAIILALPLGMAVSEIKTPACRICVLATYCSLMLPSLFVLPVWALTQDPKPSNPPVIKEAPEGYEVSG